ncbi:hypothetical protein ACTVKI_14425 [Serratia marcescens]|uniref:hypothetical protein n=1 Tax=Serratia TaxID=613 RepID=UPI001008923F|nr:MULTISPECIES: hypothetical protein [Serratia]HAT3904173.1 hypothetical protein [Citrobacter koseri]MBH3314027.1 hypothetical protein [Serratia marcescens]MCS3413067.1 hypothetical protein [Serratia marcescens]MDI3229979.1 hypothetical protein [Serratia marcescens]MDM3549359.1 hypothetical protein [Serratia nevei]
MKDFFIQCSDKLRLRAKEQGHSEFSFKPKLIEIAKELYPEFSDDELNAIVTLYVDGPNAEYTIQCHTSAASSALNSTREEMSIDEWHGFIGDYLGNSALKYCGGSSQSNKEGFNSYTITFANGVSIEFEPFLDDQGAPRLKVTPTKGLLGF